MIYMKWAPCCSDLILNPIFHLCSTFSCIASSPTHAHWISSGTWHVKSRAEQFYQHSLTLMIYCSQQQKTRNIHQSIHQMETLKNELLWGFQCKLLSEKETWGKIICILCLRTFTNIHIYMEIFHKYAQNNEQWPPLWIDTEGMG